MLTGEVRYRLGFGKKLVLQVQYQEKHGMAGVGTLTEIVWRDARVEDIRQLTQLQERKMK